MGEQALFAKHPKARGYLRPKQGYRLFSKREQLVERLTAEVRKNKTFLLESLRYPLAADALAERR